MTRQITVRLPDDQVEFIDRTVADGHAASRADVVARALEREHRRVIAERDAAILSALRGDPDRDERDGLDRLAEHVARLPLDHID